MAAPDSIRVLIVDDEAPARQRLADLLRKDAQIHSILEAGDGISAVDVIQSQRPELVFLDVQMPELDGMGVIDVIGAGQMPLTIFVTAYDQHAIRAFEANALDYLLKPFSDERFEAALSRAKLRLRERSTSEFGQRMMKLVSSALEPAHPWDRLVIKSCGSTRFIRVAEIDWIEAAGVYANLHIAGQQLLYRASLQELSERLGEFDVVLKNGARTRVSRSYRTQLENRLGQPL
jgi:two-component system LytT family response regulator